MKYYKFFYLIIIVIFISGSVSAQTYWDQFRETRHKKDGPELTTSLMVAGAPVGNLDNEVNMPGGGAVFGLHWNMGNFRLGGELGFMFFKGKSDDQMEEGSSSAEYFIMMPIVFDFGYKFKLGSFIDFYPHFFIGGSSDLLNGVEGPMAVIGNTGGNKLQWQMHFYEGVRMNFLFNLSNKYVINAGLGYGALIEFEKFTAVHLILLEVGLMIKF
ncbi:hypothetical protein ACFL20_13770 [Spirochaetota bacterium]